MVNCRPPGWNGVGEGRAKGSIADFRSGEEAQEEVTSKINKQIVIQKGCRRMDMNCTKAWRQRMRS